MTPTYRPTAQQELVLHAALQPGDAGRAAWIRVCAATPVERLDRASQSLLPLVYRNLARAATDLPGIDVVRERYLQAWRDNLRIHRAALPLIRALDEAGLRPIALKGLALIARVYRDCGVRPMADVDVLVAPGDVARVAEVAARLGWQPRYRLTPAFLRVKHAGPFDHGTEVACDVHWRVFEEAGGDALDAEVRADSEPVVFEGTRFLVPSATDLLLHVCGHAGRWNESPPIRWVADAALILRESSIDWTRLVRHAVERRFVLRMRHMLAYLRSAMGAAIPAWVEADLAGRAVSLLERFEHRVRTREQPLLGELPTYVFNCFRAEPHPVRALPGYLRDAWELPSAVSIPGHALRLALGRVRSVTSRRAGQR